VTRFRGIKGRLGKAEAAGVAATAPVPVIVIVGTNQTPGVALAVHAAAHTVRPRRHAPLVIPAKPSTDAERQRFVDRFKASQMALVREARSERLTLVVAESSAAPTTERASINRASEVVAASKVLPVKPTFSAANYLSRSLRAIVNKPDPDAQ
jgi:hypothetical protein